jgi:hypothetical protein
MLDDGVNEWGRIPEAQPVEKIGNVGGHSRQGFEGGFDQGRL